MMAKKTTKKTAAQRYDKPRLREQLKQEITQGDKGAAPGQWSARKAQMLAAAYKKHGGGYTAPKQKTQKHLDQWTEEKWSTADGQKARASKTTKRYLPKEAWEALSPAEKRKTNVKKESGSKAGKQYVENTPKAKEARKAAAHQTAAKQAKSSATKNKTRSKKVRSKNKTT